MPDWTFDAAQALGDFMDHHGPWQLVLLFVLMQGASLVLVAVHELGHALAVVLLGHRLRELRVGNDEPILIVRSRAFVFRLGPVRQDRVYGGRVVYEDAGVGPGHVIAIGLAGPLAEILVGAACAWAFVANGGHGKVLFAFAVVGLFEGARNLTVRDGVATDGTIIRDAWRGRRGAIRPPDPNEATSVAPPGR